MTVVGLHPEELFDKFLEGKITPAERERLQAHLGGCQVCRFEYRARLDFQDEARALSTASPPPLLPLRLPRSPLLAPRRRGSRWLIWGVAAAALISASAAVASGVSGKAPWQAMSSMFSRAPSPPRQRATVSARQDERGAVKAGKAETSAPKLEQAVQEAAVPLVSGPAPSRHVALRARGNSKQGLAAAAPAESAPTLEPAAKELTSAAQLFSEANQARRSGDVGRASGLYHLLQSQFPGSAEAELSRVTLSLLLLDSGDAQGALSGFERYLAGASRGLEAEALVGRARALGRLGQQNLEATAWQEVRRKYPRSIYGRQASERLSALGQP